MDPTTLEPAAWLTSLEGWRHKALLTPVPQEGWADLEKGLITKAGFAVFNSHPDNFARLGTLFNDKDTSQDQRNQPRPRRGLFFHQSPALLGDAPPAIGEQQRIITALRYYLGWDGFEWFAACCFYPQIRPELASALAERLGIDPGEVGDPMLTELGARLSSLPWLRRNNLPIWLRESVVESLPKQHQRKLRRIVAELFEQVRVSPEIGEKLQAVIGGKSMTALPIHLRNDVQDGIHIDALL